MDSGRACPGNVTLREAGMEPTGGTPAELLDIMRRDAAIWSQAVKDSGFQAEE